MFPAFLQHLVLLDDSDLLLRGHGLGPCLDDVQLAIVAVTGPFDVLVLQVIFVQMGSKLGLKRWFHNENWIKHDKTTIWTHSFLLFVRHVFYSRNISGIWLWPISQLLILAGLHGAAVVLLDLHRHLCQILDLRSRCGDILMFWWRKRWHKKSSHFMHIM